VAAVPDPKVTADQGIRLRDVSKLVAGEARDPEDPHAQIGRQVVGRLLDFVLGGGSIAPQSNPVEQVKDTLGIAKDLAGLDDTQRRRLLAKIEELEDEVARLRRGGGDGGNMLEFIKLIMDIEDRKDQRWAEAQERAEQRHREELAALRAELKSQSQSGSAAELLASIGKETITGALNRDPLAEVERMEQRLERRLNRSDPNRVIDFERWKEQQRFELEKQKLEAEERLKEKELERQNRGLEQLLALADRLGVGQVGGAPPGQPAPGQPEFRPFRCASCGKDFVLALRDVAPEIHCPHCATRLLTQPEASAAPTSGGQSA
jgi:DNA-directed RNA polymerase subunit RPC12/RpoP